MCVLGGTTDQGGEGGCDGGGGMDDEYRVQCRRRGRIEMVLVRESSGATAVAV